MKSYAVLSPILHNGVEYGVEDTIALEARDARPLLAAAVIVLPSAGELDDETVTLDAAIKTMVAEDPEKKNDAWWTQDGRPEVSQLADRTGARVTAKARDAAWAASAA